MRNRHYLSLRIYFLVKVGLPADKPTSANLAVSFHSYTVNVNWFAFKILEHQILHFIHFFFFIPRFMIMKIESFIPKFISCTWFCAYQVVA